MDEADYLYLDREKERLEYELHSVLMCGSEEELEEIIERLEEYKERKFGPDKMGRVINHLQEIQEIASKRGDIDMFRGLIITRTNQIASLLEVELMER